VEGVYGKNNKNGEADAQSEPQAHGR
jgi:hypothetical protein